MSLDGVKLKLVDSIEEAFNLLQWLGERRPLNALAVDLETTGLDRQNDRIKLAQIGDGMTGWAIPWEHWNGVFRDIMSRWEGDVLTFNGPCFDLVFMRREGIDIEQHRVKDGMVRAAVNEPHMSKGLKQQAGRHVDAAAGGLGEVLKGTKWTWENVPVTYGPYWQYGALDTILTYRVEEYHRPITEQYCQDAYDLELATQFVTERMERYGAHVDRKAAASAYAKFLKFCDEVEDWCVRNYGVKPGSNQAVVKILQEAGHTFSKATASGAVSLDAEVLEGIEHPLAQQVLARRQLQKLASTYLRFYMDRADANDLLHPSINTLGARTGRMCIPTTHGLLTPDGVVGSEDVRPGLLTLDVANQWVRVTAVHRYQNAPLDVLRSFNLELLATPEHRWVTTREHEAAYASRTGKLAPAPKLRSWRDHPRLNVHLAPETDLFDFSARTVPATTDGQRFAALVGMLVTDGRCTDSDIPGVGLRAYVYQSEKKFYDEFIKVIPPEAIGQDRITTQGDRHHEIRLRARWLRPRLRVAGLAPGELLKESSTLHRWVSGLPLDELRAFFSACWLADGSTYQKVISCGSKNLRAVLLLAAYRLGYVGQLTNEGRGGWSTKDRLGLRFRSARLSNRFLKRQEIESADVWCVTTETGTFTAHAPSGTLYLTGNSVSEPNMQNLPRQGTNRAADLVRNMIVSRYVPLDLPEDDWMANYHGSLLMCDFAQIEMRLLAHFSGEPALIEAFRHPDLDFFVALARQIYGDETITKKDPRRQITKNSGYAKVYGAGPRKFAQTAGIPESQARDFLQRFDMLYPGVQRFSNETLNMAFERQKTEGLAYTRSPFTGRPFVADSRKEYALINYLIQGSAAEILKRKLLELDAAGLGPWMFLPVHDEILLDVPGEHVQEAADVLQRVMNDHALLTVPVEAEVSYGRRWGSKKDWDLAAIA